MNTTYKSIIATQRGGGPETLKIKVNQLRAPKGKEARIRIQATPVCQDDVAKRVGNRPFLPKIPFVPGYSVLGVIDAIGEDAGQFSVGDRVAALTTYGGYSEYIYIDEDELVSVPDSLDAGLAVTIPLNYLVAYQILHRVTKVKPGEKALIIGASGGVGTTFLQLGKLAGLRMYGTASKSKHSILEKYGATQIDYRSEDFVKVINELEPDGIDYVFNGMDREFNRRGFMVLRRGGTLVQYGAPESMRSLLLLLGDLLRNKLIGDKKLSLYGTHRVGVEDRKKDWEILFKLLEEARINPIISERLGLFDAVKANMLLENGKVTGQIVLLN